MPLRPKAPHLIDVSAGTPIPKPTASAARTGPVLWLLSAQYFVVQVVVAAAWARPYSWARNTISDLGNTRCGRYGARAVCSPEHPLMNASFVLLGLTMLAGAVLLARQLATARPPRIGFALLAVAGFGTIMVGLFPENTVAPLHLLGAVLPFVLGNLGVLVLGLSLPDLPSGPRAFTVAAGAVALVGFPLFVAHAYLGLGPGGMERVTAYPQDIWLIAAGAYLLGRPKRAAQCS